MSDTDPRPGLAGGARSLLSASSARRAKHAG